MYNCVYMWILITVFWLGLLSSVEVKVRLGSCLWNAQTVTAHSATNDRSRNISAWKMRMKRRRNQARVRKWKHLSISNTKDNGYVHIHSLHPSKLTIAYRVFALSRGVWIFNFKSSVLETSQKSPDLWI